MNRCGGCGARKSSPLSPCTVCGLAPAPRRSAPPLRPPAPQLAPAPEPRGSTRRRQGFVAIFSLLAVVGSSSYLLGRATNPGGVLSAPGAGRQSGSVRGGIFAAARQPVPAEVVAYLRWLKWFESERHRMQLNQIFSLAPLATTAAYADLLSEDAPPLQGPPELAVARRFEEKVSPVIKGWSATVEVFDKQPTPAACQELARHYRAGLTHTKSALATIFAKTVGTIQKLAGQQDKESLARPTLGWLQEQKEGKALSHRADDGFFAANAALEKLRSRYRELPADIDSAHFSIAPDGG
jgi:hypothetical protein